MSVPEHAPPMVVEAGPADVAVLHDLLQRSFGEYAGVLDPPSGVFRETPESIARHLAGAGALIARAGEEPVGCAFYSPREDHLYVGRFGVLPAWRRAGVGGLLLAAAERRALELGFTCVRLFVRAQLVHLLRYYESRGFAIVGGHSHEGYAGITYWGMEKRLLPGPAPR